MSLTTCAVSFRVYTDDGLPDAGATVSAVLNQFEVYDGYVVPDLVSGTTNASGLAVLNLWPNELGSTASMYTIKIASTNGKRLRTTAVVPNVAFANIEDIAELPAYEGKTEGQLMLSSAVAAGATAVSAATAAALSATNSATSATSAAASASTATSQAILATSRATSAENSATSAAASATAASTSATNSANSATASQASANSIAGSVTAATTQATNASNSATGAATSATNAAASATSAADSAAIATTKAAEASTSASAASSSATTSSTKASEASASAANAVNSVTEAASQANAALISATNASISASSSATQADIAATKANDASASAASALAIYGSISAINTAVDSSTTQAGIATTQAGIATTAATNASNSATSAATSASNAAASQAALATNYRGTWNASTNSPTLTSSSGTQGHYYIVSTAGSTTLNGVTPWVIGDGVVFNGTAWQKIAYNFLNGPTTLSVNSTENAFRITQTGTGNAFVVEDAANPDSTPFVIDNAGYVYVGSGLTVSGFPTVDQSDIGTAQNEIPLNGFLGNLAYQDAANIAGDVGIGGAVTSTSGVINANNTTSAVRITQIGTGNALVVEDSTNPDASPFLINATGQVVVGSTSPITYAGISGSLQVNSNGQTAFQLAGWQATAAAPPQFMLARSASGTVGTNGAVADGFDLGAIRFLGDDGATFIPAATILAEVDGTPGLNDMPGRLVFSTTADGASTPTERMRIANTGLVTLAATSGLSIGRTAVTAPAATDGNVFSGTYTPTLTNTTNVSASTSSVCQYTRVGSIVTVSGAISIDPTATGATLLGISLPVVSDFAGTNNAAGTAVESDTSRAGRIFADTTNDRLSLAFDASDVANRTWSFICSYRVL